MALTCMNVTCYMLGDVDGPIDGFSGRPNTSMASDARL